MPARKKQPIKPYTLLWFLQLLFYGFYWSHRALVRAFHKVFSYFNPMLWLLKQFPPLDRSHRAGIMQRHGLSPEEYADKVVNDPNSFMNNLDYGVHIWYARYARDTVLASLTVGVFNLFFFVVGLSLYNYLKFFWVHGLVVVVIVYVISMYLEWDDKHIAYFKVFEKLRQGQKRLLGWLCALVLIGAFAFAILTLALLPRTAGSEGPVKPQQERHYRRPYRRRWWRGFAYHSNFPELPAQGLSGHQ